MERFQVSAVGPKPEPLSVAEEGLEPDDRYSGGAVGAVGVAIGCLAASVGSTYQLLAHFPWGPVDWGPSMLVSLLVAVAWVGLTEGKTRGMSVPGIGLLVFCPVLGPVLSASLLLWVLLSPPPDEGEGELGRQDMVEFDITTRMLRQGGETDGERFVPAVALLDSQDINERRAAIDVLASIGGPEQILHLQSCLDDPEREVYQYAHAKLTELHEKHTDAIREAQGGPAQNLLDAYLLYLRSGLLGEATSTFYRRKAIATTREMLQARAGEVSLLALLGQLYLEDGQSRLCAEVLEQAVALDPDSVEARWGLTRLAYAQRDYETFRRNLTSLRSLISNKKVANDVITRTIGFWSDGLAPEAGKHD